MQHYYKGRCDKVTFLLLCAIVVCFFTSFVSNLLTLVVCLSTIVYCFFRKNTITRPFILFFTFVFISFQYVFLFNRGDFVILRNVALSYSTILLSLLLYPVLLELSYKHSRCLLLLMTICIVYSLLVTIAISYFDPSAVRLMGFGVDDNNSSVVVLSSMYLKLGMASYLTLHGWTIVAPLYLILGFEVSKRIYKIIFIVIAVLTVYCLYVASVTTSFILSTISCFMIVLFYLCKGSKIRFLISCVVLLFILSLSGALFGIATNMMNGENTMISGKIKDIVLTFQTGQSQGQVDGRLSLYNESLFSFMSSPLWGGAVDDEIGQHSLIIDMLAYYGLFAFLAFSAWWKSFRDIKQIIDQKKRFLLTICLYTIVVLALIKGRVFLATYFITSISVVYIFFLHIIKLNCSKNYEQRGISSKN